MPASAVTKSIRKRPGRASATRLATVRNRRGDVVTPVSVTASVAKSEFGRVLETALHEGAVVITRHNAPRAVLISVEQFNALAGASETVLDTLDREFDALLDRMQTPGTRRGLKMAFSTSGKDAGKAAVAAVRKRGK